MIEGGPQRPPRIPASRLRRPYVARGLPSDAILSGLLLGFGLPPVVTTRPFLLRSHADAAWAQDALGPLFFVAASTYHSLYCEDPATGRYGLAMRAWTDSPAVLRCDVSDELAEGLAAEPWDVSLTPACWLRSWAKGKTRVTLATPVQAKDFASAVFAASSARGQFGVVAAWGARWRSTSDKGASPPASR